MIIDTFFNAGDNVCYLSGDSIYNAVIREIEIQIDYTKDLAYSVYKLSDGLRVTYQIKDGKWGTRLFKDKESLIKYLQEQ